MGSHARPAPVFGTGNQPRPDRVEAHITQRRMKMRLIRRDRSEPPLPQMAGLSCPCIYIAGIAPVEVAKGAAQPIFVGRHDDRMDMIGHQAIGPDGAQRALCCLREKIEIKGIVGIFEEGLPTTVTTLGNVMRNAGEDKSGKSGHKGCFLKSEQGTRYWVSPLVG